jgi:hypothetical protein
MGFRKTYHHVSKTLSFTGNQIAVKSAGNGLNKCELRSRK